MADSQRCPSTPAPSSIRIPAALTTPYKRSEESASAPSINAESYHPALRSSHVAFVDWINETFLARDQPLICFSLPIAACISLVSSKCTRRSTRYRFVNPSSWEVLCCHTRRRRSFVTPVYRQWDRLARMYTK